MPTSTPSSMHSVGVLKILTNHPALSVPTNWQGRCSAKSAWQTQILRARFSIRSVTRRRTRRILTGKTFSRPRRTWRHTVLLPLYPKLTSYRPPSWASASAWTLTSTWCSPRRSPLAEAIIHSKLAPSNHICRGCRLAYYIKGNNCLGLITWGQGTHCREIQHLIFQFQILQFQIPSSLAFGIPKQASWHLKTLQVVIFADTQMDDP